MKYVIVKVDTTGLNPESADIVKISALYVKDEDKRKISTYVNPQMPIPEDASKISGIYNNDVKDAPTFDEIKDSFLKFIGDAPLVGHNLDFDLKFINKHFDVPIENKSMNLMNLARAIGYCGSLKFASMRKHYEVPEYYDTVDATDMIFKEMLSEFQSKKDNRDA